MQSSNLSKTIKANVVALVQRNPRLRAAAGVARFAIDSANGPDLYCPLCNERRRFVVSGRPPRPNALCPACESLERHRLLFSYLNLHPELTLGKSILHFAPESAIERYLTQQEPNEYITADLAPGRADIVLSIEDITWSNHFDLIIASHILEHVNDRIALRELYKSLKPGGLAIVMVPIVEGWASTYENAQVKTDAERLRHFGQEDHIRVYGRDLRTRIQDAGFSLEEFTASPADCLAMGLTPGERIFLAWKRDP